MKIEKVIIKDIEIVLSDEECQCGGNCSEKGEGGCKCSQGEENLMNSLSGMVEAFSETITDYLKDELIGKKKVDNIREIFKGKKEPAVKPVVVEKPVDVVKEKIIEKIEKKEEPIEPEKVQEVKVEEVTEEEVPVKEVIEEPIIIEVKDAVVEEEPKVEKREMSQKEKIEEERKKILKNMSPSSELNDFINKILNSMPD